MHLPCMPCLYGRRGPSLHGDRFASGSRRLCDRLNFLPHSRCASQLACELSCVPEVALKRRVRTYLAIATSTPRSPSLNPTMWTHIRSFTNFQSHLRCLELWSPFKLIERAIGLNESEREQGCQGSSQGKRNKVCACLF